MATAKSSRHVPEPKSPVCVRVGARIRELRTAKGWTQQLLADHAEVERAHLARLESGEREAGLIVLERIAQALEVETVDLLREVSWMISAR